MNLFQYVVLVVVIATLVLASLKWYSIQEPGCLQCRAERVQRRAILELPTADLSGDSSSEEESSDCDSE